MDSTASAATTGVEAEAIGVDATGLGVLGDGVIAAWVIGIGVIGAGVIGVVVEIISGAEAGAATISLAGTFETAPAIMAMSATGAEVACREEADMTSGTAETVELHGSS